MIQPNTKTEARHSVRALICLYACQSISASLSWQQLRPKLRSVGVLIVPHPDENGAFMHLYCLT